MQMFDIVIPVGPSDTSIIYHQIEYTKQNIVGYRNIYLIASDADLDISGCIIIPECIFPFSIQTVTEYHTKNARNGWYLQQLLKLYAGSVIPNILDMYLVIDADTFFVKPTSFLCDNKPCYNFGTENHRPYFEHIDKIFGKHIYKVDAHKSGICHHMLFEQKYVNEIFSLVESIHKLPFWQVFLSNVVDITRSGASEYEIYFNYVLLYHKNEIVVRSLCWANSTSLKNKESYDYISVHWYNRDVSIV
jgi:hypothetical protein